jgi:glycosyltransferase involved in cell wall biosynthesis
LIIFDWWHPFFGLCHGIISSLIRDKYSKKILFITENVVSHEANRIDKVLTKFGLKNASMFLALSKNVEEELARFTTEKKIYRSELPVYDCYNSDDLIDILKFKNELNINKDDKIILFFGYIRQYKGLDILLEGFSKILKKYPETFLLVVGEFYENSEKYFNLIDKYNIKQKVKVINQFVPNEEVSKYYLASDVVILPYKSATQSGILNIAYGFKPNSADEIAYGYTEFLKLQELENFQQNIIEHSQKNSFENLPKLINKIIEDTGD